MIVSPWGELPSEEPAERFETEQQATGHLVGSWRPDHVLIHRQNVAQAAIEWPLLITRGATCRPGDELHHLHTDADDMRIGAGEYGELPVGGLSTVEQSRPQIAHNVEKIRAGCREQRLGAPDGLLHVDIVAQDFRGFAPLANGVAPRRFAGCAVDQRVDRMTAYTTCRG